MCHTVFITSNIPLDQWYASERRERTEGLIRRCHVIKLDGREGRLEGGSTTHAKDRDEAKDKIQELMNAQRVQEVPDIQGEVVEDSQISITFPDE